MKKYMVIANFASNENNNLEIIDFDLTLEQAKEVYKNTINFYKQEGYEYELENICICEHGNFIYN
jgi:hypothetical protein